MATEGLTFHEAASRIYDPKKSFSPLVIPNAFPTINRTITTSTPLTQIPTQGYSHIVKSSSAKKRKPQSPSPPQSPTYTREHQSLLINSNGRSPSTSSNLQTFNTSSTTINKAIQSNVKTLESYFQNALQLIITDPTTNEKVTQLFKFIIGNGSITPPPNPSMEHS